MHASVGTAAGSIPVNGLLRLSSASAASDDVTSVALCWCGVQCQRGHATLDMTLFDDDDQLSEGSDGGISCVVCNSSAHASKMLLCDEPDCGKGWHFDVRTPLYNGWVVSSPALTRQASVACATESGLRVWRADR